MQRMTEAASPLLVHTPSQWIAWAGKNNLKPTWLSAAQARVKTPVLRAVLGAPKRRKQAIEVLEKKIYDFLDAHQEKAVEERGRPDKYAFVLKACTDALGCPRAAVAKIFPTLKEDRRYKRGGQPKAAKKQ